MATISIQDITEKEIIEKLQNGEKLYYNKDIYWIMINGILVKYQNNHCIEINSHLDLEKDIYLYFMVKEEFKIEVGKFYKTVMGNKVFCYNIRDNDPFPFKMVTMNKQDGFGVNAEGNRYTDLPSGDDIVDYWKD